MKIITGLFISILFLTTAPSLTFADSCLCTDRATAKPETCEQKGETECYSQLSAEKSCSFYADESCKNLKNVLVTGFTWTEPACDRANGDWRPEDNGAGIGPYCYEKQDFAEPYKLKIDILNVNDESGGIKNLGQYINLIYKLVVGLAIFFAIIATTVAGFKWLTAGGNSGKIGEAKKMIGNALIGLILAAGAYTILQTINPRLLELHLPLIPKIKTINYVGVSDCGGYLTQGDCELNARGTNAGVKKFSPYAKDTGNGCAWDPKIRICVQQGNRKPGEVGGICINETCGSGLSCVSLGASGDMCTAGAANQACGSCISDKCENDGCQNGLTCDSFAHTCYDEKLKRPDNVSCSNDNQCVGGICFSGHCVGTGCLSTDECDPGYHCLLTGMGEARKCAPIKNCIIQNTCTTYYGSDYWCPGEIYLPNARLLIRQYLTAQYSVQRLESGTGISACYEKRNVGGRCVDNLECKSGNCAGELDIILEKTGTCQ